MSTIIKIENLSKLYRLGTISSGTVRDDFSRWWAKINKKEDPLQKIGERNIQNKSGKSDQIWALKDINLEVREGDVLGIIGKNGAGKSTLLKVLSRITSPTTGIARIKGRIASLLEVGTGFHPELTGRENIYLNGAILGMTKGEITAKLDEIIDFSGIERYIDTPVKRYSSGMYVRLAFAVAAHLEPEILLIDEVLAVGDYSFQEKCLGKMRNIADQGRTILFVSHNLGSIKNLCKNTILLENGSLVDFNEAKLVVNKYISNQKNKEGDLFIIDNKRIAYLKKVSITDMASQSIHEVPINKPFFINFQIVVQERIKKFVFAFNFTSIDGVSIRTIWSKPEDLEPGEYEIKFKEDKIFLTGEYYINCGISISGHVSIQQLENVKRLVFEDWIDKSIAFDSKSGHIINQGNTTINKIPQ